MTIHFESLGRRVKNFLLGTSCEIAFAKLVFSIAMENEANILLNASTPRRSYRAVESPELDATSVNSEAQSVNSRATTVPVVEKKKYFAYLRNRRFWFIVLHGQVLSWVITCTNSLTTEINNNGTSFPALQTLFVYNVLFLIFTPYTIYKLGWKAWGKLVLFDGWKFFFLAFADVEGNYFIVKAYEYTNILSAALLDNFAIVVVVILSFIFLKVRYHWTQYISIVVCIGGMALLVVSDHLSGKDYSASDPVKGDLFVILAAACYGVCNTWEEYFVSKRPLYVVLGQLGMWATIINGVQCAIFERDSIRNANWNVAVGLSVMGYTLAMLLLYTTSPILFRMSSAAFYNLSILTSDFWSLLIGTRIFGYGVYWLYPVGFVFIVLGVMFYCAAPMTHFGESFKPWLGENQEQGIAGVGTAKLELQKHNDKDATEPHVSVVSV